MRQLFLRRGGQFCQDAQVFKRGGVTLDFSAGSDLFEEPAHDFAGARFGQGIRKANIVRLGDGPDLFGDMLAQFFTQGGLGAEATFEGDEGNQRLTFEIIRSADHRGLGNFWMADERALDLRGADAMAGNIEDIIDAANDPEIAVFVLPAAITGEVAALDLAPINLFVALRIAPEAAQHA